MSGLTSAATSTNDGDTRIRGNVVEGEVAAYPWLAAAFWGCRIALDDGRGREGKVRDE